MNPVFLSFQDILICNYSEYTESHSMLIREMSFKLAENYNDIHLLVYLYLYVRKIR